MYDINDPKFKPGTKAYEQYQKSMALAKSYQDKEDLMRENIRKSLNPVEERNLPVPIWTEMKGTKVYKIPDSQYIAVPASGTKSSRNFIVIHETDMDVYVQLSKKEVNGWLISAYQTEKNTISGVSARFRTLRVLNL